MRLKYLLIIVVFVPKLLLGQTTSISPYSGFGLGELVPQGYDYSFAMGGIGYAFNDSLSINPMNPASYSHFKKYNPIFQIGYKGQLLKVSSAINSQELNNGTINNIALGFKLGSKIGWAFGFNPATAVGYKVVVTEPFTDGNGKEFPVRYNFEGDGGYTKLYMGFSYEIFQKSDTILGQLSSLSAGININYYNGSKRSLYDIIYDSGDFSYYNTQYEESQIISDFGFDLGLQYQTYLKKISPSNYVNLSIGATFNIPKNLKTKWKSNYFTYTYDATEQIFPVDTIFYSDDLKGDTYIPLRLGIGLMVDINNQLQIGVDYEKQNWNDFKQEVNGLEIPNNNVTDSWRISAGLQYTMVPLIVRKMNTSYFKTITYRLGARYTTNYLKFQDYQLDDKAISFGFNFPLSKSQSYSSINFGMEFGTQGTTENNLVKQDYTNIMVGIILLPHRFNRWFQKKKYN